MYLHCTYFLIFGYFFWSLCWTMIYQLIKVMFNVIAIYMWLSVQQGAWEQGAFARQEGVGCVCGVDNISCIKVDNCQYTGLAGHGASLYLQVWITPGVHIKEDAHIVPTRRVLLCCHDCEQESSRHWRYKRLGGDVKITAYVQMFVISFRMKSQIWNKLISQYIEFYKDVYNWKTVLAFFKCI